MTDEERREWLAGLRPGDRVAHRNILGDYVHGCVLLTRRKPYDWRPDDPLWEIALDPVDIMPDIDRMLVWESELVPLPYPDLTGFVYVGPPPKPRRRRSRPKAKAASA